MDRWRMIVFVAVLAAGAGCSGDGGVPDGRVDALDAEDGDGAGDRDQPACHLEDGFCLILEPGARACSIWPDQRGWHDEVAALGTVEFVTGTVELRTDPATFEASLVTRILHGRERREPTARGPGTFRYEFSQLGDPQTGYHRFHFEQSFDLDGEDYAFVFVLEFYQDNGVVERRAARIDEHFTPHIWSMAGLPGDGQDWARNQRFGSCTMHDLPLWHIRAGAENGDTVFAHKRLELSLGGSGRASIVWAEVSVNGAARQIDEYFDLVYAALHHNWSEQVLVLLDPPVGDVHALLLEDAGYSDPPATLVYLDADLATLRTSPLASYSEAQP